MAAASIFICHAPADADFSRDLTLALETFRLSVWRDHQNLRGGDRLAPEVRWAIEQARQVIVVLGLNTGDPTWLRREIELAQEVERRRANTYRVIPLLLPGLDATALAQWFAPAPRTPPIPLTADGLGAALPDLLIGLGETPPGDPPSHRNPLPVAELELNFSGDGSSCAGDWRLSVRLNPGAEQHPPAATDALSGPLPGPLPARLLHWYLQSHPLWPTDTLRFLARRAETRLAAWGRDLYRATLDAAGSRELTAAWLAAPEQSERRLVVRADPAHSAAAALALPWELLRDPGGFLLQGKRPIQVLRRLSGGGNAFAPAPPPLRVLALGPRPDTEPTGHPDHRRSALPLLEALGGLGGLAEPQVLSPPTLGALEKRLSDAWAGGRPFAALHLDGYLRHDPGSNATQVGFEASYDLHAPICREAHFVAATTLASLLATYRIRLVVLCSCSDNAAGPSVTVGLASALLAAGIAAVITVHPDTPTETQRRFWVAFYEELLRGARIGQALFAAQRRLAGDGYRAPGLGGGGVHLQDWFCCNLYLGEQDPRLGLRPPLDLWRRLLKQAWVGPPGRLPPPPPAGFVGRGRDLLILERLLEERSTVFLRGPGGTGKTATAAALATWLGRCGRYRHMAYACGDDAGEPRALLETLGRQLLPQGEHWSVDRFPTLWQALDHLRQTLRPRPALIVLDQLDRWPSEHDDILDQFWKDFLNEWPDLHLLGLGRLGPPAFAQPWIEATLSPMDDRDAISLIGRTLIAAGEMPPAADSGGGFRQLCDFVRLSGGHPGALQRVAREIGARGADATLALLRPLRAELLRRHGDDPQWPLLLSLELALRRLPPEDRDRLPILAFFKEGANRIALGKALQLDSRGLDSFCERLVGLNLAEDRGYGHLRFDPALSHYLSGQLPASQRPLWRERWCAGMEQLLEMLYQQYFKDKARTNRLLRLELPNLLASLRDRQQHSGPEKSAHLAGRLEQLLANLGAPAALAEVVAARERAGQALSGWSRIRFETERLRVERLRDDGSLEDALQAVRKLLRQCQEAGPEAYPGADYDLARTHLQLGKLLKLAGAAEPAVRELTESRRRFQALAGAGNISAGRMVAVVDAETGDCLIYLQRLQEAAAAYEAAIARAGPNAIDLTVAANKMQLGLVRQRQGHYSRAAALYETARRMFESLGEPEGTARAWRQLALARKLDGDMPAALHACQQALYLYEQHRNRGGIAETLGELGHLHLAMRQLEEAVLAYRRMAELCQQLGDGLGEEAARNNLANVLIQLRRHDEARQELYRASECNLPDSFTARNWAIRRGLHDVGQEVPDSGVADRARQQAIEKYLAYRRAGGKNNNPGARLCARIGRAIRAGDAAGLSGKLEQIAVSPNVPAAGKLLIAKLQAILAGSRDPAVASDPNLHYQYAAELRLLLEELASGS